MRAVSFSETAGLGLPAVGGACADPVSASGDGFDTDAFVCCCCCCGCCCGFWGVLFDWEC